MIRLAREVGVTEYPEYKEFPTHTRKRFGCGMPVTVDDKTK